MRKILYVLVTALGLVFAIPAEEKKYDPSAVTIAEVKEHLDRMPATHPRLFVKRADTFTVFWKIEDLTKAPNEWDVSNKGHSMVSFTLTAPLSGRVTIKVILKPETQRAAAAGE